MSDKGRKINEDTFKLDPTKSPPWIDVTHKRGKAGEFVKGIYQTRTTSAGFELTLAITLDDAKSKDRPKDFKGNVDTTVLKLLRKGGK